MARRGCFGSSAYLDRIDKHRTARRLVRRLDTLGYDVTLRSEATARAPPDHLVANLLIFHTVVGMTNALDGLGASGHRGAIGDEALAGLSPHRAEHINRFGDHVLDLGTPPAPLPFVLQTRSRPPRRG
jgi:Tn3 transposase DDE domain